MTAREEQRMNSKKTVLITDDSKTNQELLTAILGDKDQYL